MPNCTYFQNTSGSDIASHTCRVIWYECEIPRALVFAVIRHWYNQSSSRCSWSDFMVISRPHWGLRQMAFCQHQVGHYTSCSNFCLFWCPRAVCDLKETNQERKTINDKLRYVVFVIKVYALTSRYIDCEEPGSICMPWKKKKNTNNNSNV